MLRLMLVFSMELMAMVLVWDMLVLDMVVLAIMVRGLLMLSLRLKLMLVFCMEPMATVPVLAMLVLATMARGPLMLSQRLMLVCTMEDMDMVLVWDMLDLDMDIPVLDMLDMEVMDSDTVLDTDVPSMVKQLIYASKSSKVIFLLFSALMGGRNFVFHVLEK